MNHTPGPWKALKGDLVMGSQVVAVGVAPDGAGHEEQRANARLLAAAPEMYAALQATVAYFERANQPPDFVLEIYALLARME
jgi:hypothetical protein